MIKDYEAANRLQSSYDCVEAFAGESPKPSATRNGTKVGDLTALFAGDAGLAH